jgi:hypothetical protein
MRENSFLSSCVFSPTTHCPELIHMNFSRSQRIVQKGTSSCQTFRCITFAAVLSIKASQTSKPKSRGGEIGFISGQKELQNHFSKMHTWRRGKLFLPFFRLSKVPKKGT